jgi:polyisoprenyl-teichoic acid--peptidoglycan teichoic acid transferase
VATVGYDAERVRFRRAVVLILMTLVLPGSAQIVAGDRRIGQVAIRAWLAALAMVGLGIFVAVFRPTLLVWLATSSAVLTAARLALFAAAVGWAVLLVDAWRLGSPLSFGRHRRLAMTGLIAATVVSVVAGLSFAASVVGAQRDFVHAVFGGEAVAEEDDGRYNVLLLGGDAAPNRSGVRPDSITVASIDAETGRTVLFGLPRNLENVPFPDGSLLDRRFPEGFDCEGCYLNAVYTWAGDHARLFPKVENPGLLATKQAVEEITGLRISYHAMVDMGGFVDLVDAVGGVTLNVAERTPIGGIGSPISGWIDPGRQHLDGFHALWYARSRVVSDDYSRMARQKCVLSAMLTQLDPATVVRRFRDIAAAGQRVVSTDVPPGEVATLVELALKARRLPLATVSFVPPMVDTGDPDFDRIRQEVSAALERAEAADRAAESGPDSNPPERARRAQADHRRAPSGDQVGSEDLARSCATGS